MPLYLESLTPCKHTKSKARHFAHYTTSRLYKIEFINTLMINILNYTKNTYEHECEYYTGLRLKQKTVLDVRAGYIRHAVKPLSKNGLLVNNNSFGTVI